MHGRSLCLLVILSLLAPLRVGSQTERRASDSQITSDFAIRWPTIIQTPDVGPGTSPVRPPLRSPGIIGFQGVARAARTIFSGTVTAIERHPATHGQPIETVAITFHVENAIRGTTPGSDLTISQWIGLWSGGQRYRVGERVLLFLYPLSKLGLTSCVAWPTGRFNVDGQGRILLSAQHLVSFRKDPVLGGKSHARFSDFALAVRRASEEE